ncbi:MAG TPA: transporter substrate-binding domain-containing protein, partial [Roseateles sp.]|nr:transporter substrate-binding domain-containing protein [Roseateles sp.]
ITEKPPQAPGALAELLTRLGEELGLADLRPQFYPFARAALLAQRGPRVAIAPLARIAAREAQYRWLLPLFQQRYMMVARAERWPRFAALDNMLALRVVTLRGAIGAKRLRELQYAHVGEENSYEHMLRRLDEESTDLAYISQPLFVGAVQSSGRKLRDYQFGPVLDQLEIWLAGSPDFSDADVQALRAALERLKRDGSYARFLQKANLAPDIIAIR